MRYTRPIAFCLLIAGIVVAACSTASAEEDAIHVLTIDGAIGPITERYIDRGLGRAEDEQAKLVIIEMDTPGGLSSATREIVQRIEASSVPVAVYVTPSGGRAASAGTFITMSAHIAVMAPNTSIGAAASVNSDGSDIGGTMGDKVENDSVAFIRGIAELRGRNADWAEDAVRDAIAATGTEAVELNVVDFVAQTREALISEIDGTSVELRPGTTVELRELSMAPIVETDLTIWERFLEIIADPNIATILISLGFLGLVFELMNPGAMIPGIFGVMALLIGFLGLGVLPVETVGLVLIALALILFALELFVASGGILGAGGIAAMVLGGVIAFRDTPSEVQPNRILVVVLASVVTFMFVSLAVGLARARNSTSVMGTEAMLGRVAIARTPLAPDGTVFIDGERWRARMATGSAREGDRLRIIGASGLRLRVEQERMDDPGRPATEG